MKTFLIVRGAVLSALKEVGKIHNHEGMQFAINL